MKSRQYYSLPLFFLIFILIVPISCSKDPSYLENAFLEKDYPIAVRNHITNDDIVCDAAGLHLNFSLGDALVKNIAADEYLSICQRLEILNNTIATELATRSGEEIVSYGLLRLSASNQDSGVTSPPILFSGYDAVRIIAHFSVPDYYGTSMVSVCVPDTIDIFYFVGTGQTIKNYPFNGSSVSLSYAYNPDLTGDQFADMVYAIIGIEL